MDTLDPLVEPNQAPREEREPILPGLPARQDGSSTPSLLADRWRLDVQIGQGAFGKVWRARDVQTSERVAIKLFNPGHEGSGYLQELGLLFSETHEHIVRVHSFGYNKGQRYIVYEYVPGGSLRDLLVQSPRLEPCVALQLARDMLSGLKFAHARDVVHRDLKPENILLTSTRWPLRAKLCDFGLATRSRAGARLTSRYGSPGYMAPEQFEGNYDRRVDYWAVGVILYELLFGRRPYDGDPVSIRHAHRHATVPYPEDAPPQLLSLLKRLLAVDPEERYADPDAILSDIEAALVAVELRQRQRTPTLSQPMFRDVKLEHAWSKALGGRALRASVTERGELLVARADGLDVMMMDARLATLVKTREPIDALMEGGHMGHAIGWLALGKLWAFERGAVREIVGDYTLPERSRRVLWTPKSERFIIHSNELIELVGRDGRVQWRAQIPSYGVLPPLCVSNDGEVIWIAQEAPRTQLVALSMAGERLVRTAAGGADVVIVGADEGCVIVGTRGQRQLMRIDRHGFIRARVELTESLTELCRVNTRTIAALSARHLQLLDARSLRSHAMLAMPSATAQSLFTRAGFFCLTPSERDTNLDLYCFKNLEEGKTP